MPSLTCMPICLLSYSAAYVISGNKDQFIEIYFVLARLFFAYSVLKQNFISFSFLDSFTSEKTNEPENTLSQQ